MKEKEKWWPWDSWQRSVSGPWRYFPVFPKVDAAYGQALTGLRVDGPLGRRFLRGLSLTRLWREGCCRAPLNYRRRPLMKKPLQPPCGCRKCIPLLVAPATKGGKSHRRWLIIVMLILPYDTESKSRNADFISIARRAIRNPRPEGPSNLRTFRTLGPEARQPSHRRCVQWPHPKPLRHPFSQKDYVHRES